MPGSSRSRSRSPKKLERKGSEATRAADALCCVHSVNSRWIKMAKMAVCCRCHSFAGLKGLDPHRSYNTQQGIGRRIRRGTVRRQAEQVRRGPVQDTLLLNHLSGNSTRGMVSCPGGVSGGAEGSPRPPQVSVPQALTALLRLCGDSLRCLANTRPPPAAMRSSCN